MEGGFQPAFLDKNFVWRFLRDMDWTEEKIKKLKKMRTEGVHYYGIGLVLGCSEGAVRQAVQKFIFKPGRPSKTDSRIDMSKRKVALRSGSQYALHDLGLPKNTFVGWAMKGDIPKDFIIVF